MKKWRENGECGGGFKIHTPRFCPSRGRKKKNTGKAVIKAHNGGGKHQKQGGNQKLFKLRKFVWERNEEVKKKLATTQANSNENSKDKRRVLDKGGLEVAHQLGGHSPEGLRQQPTRRGPRGLRRETGGRRTGEGVGLPWGGSM